MAKVVNYEFSRRSHGNRYGKYPWSLWLDGKTRELIRSRDFPDASASSFAANARRTGVMRGLSVQADVLDPSTVILQAVIPVLSPAQYLHRALGEVYRASHGLGGLSAQETAELAELAVKLSQDTRKLQARLEEGL